MPEQVWAAVGKYLENPFILGAVLLGFAYLTLSKRMAEISGPIGALARWWNSRQVQRVKRDHELWQTIHRTERQRDTAQHDADRRRDTAELQQLRTDVDWLRRDLADMRKREQLRDAQARKHTAWDNDVMRQMQRAGLEVVEPPPLYLDLPPLYVPPEGKHT